MNNLFGFLYARPSAVEGVARIMDFGNTLNEYNYSSTSDDADFLALRADWRVVARDLGIAFKEEIQEHNLSGGNNPPQAK